MGAQRASLAAGSLGVWDQTARMNEDWAPEFVDLDRILASADGFTDACQTARERVTAIAPWLGGSDPRSGLRADMTIAPGPKGGAVFTTGSITFCATLGFNGCDSDASRILANVIDGFVADNIPGV